MWKGLREFFTYNRKQRNGIFVLLGLIVVLLTGLYFDDLFYGGSSPDLREFKEAVSKWEKEDSIARYGFVDDLFIFDPNTLEDTAFLKLGLTATQQRNIINYRNKGGKFRKPEDLLNIYGMDSLWFQFAQPYIKIENPKTEGTQDWEPEYNFSKIDPNTIGRDAMIKMGLAYWQADRIITYRKKVRPFREKEQFYEVYGLDSSLVERMLPFVEIDSSTIPEPPPEPEPVIVELNSADSLQLLELKGVGPAFSGRILEYRQKLGGFVSLEQLKEVYGVDSAKYTELLPQLSLDKSLVQKINVNTASFEELLAHPYLEYKVVGNIVNFREKARPYKNVQELKNIELVDEALFNKIANYLKVE